MIRCGTEAVVFGPSSSMMRRTFGFSLDTLVVSSFDLSQIGSGATPG